MLKFEVGKTYRTRDGKLEFLLVHIGLDWLCFAHPSGSAVSRRLDGRVSETFSTPVDFVEEVVPIVSKYRNIYENSAAQDWYHSKQIPISKRSDPYIGYLRRDSKGGKVVGYEFFPVGLDTSE